MTIRNYPQKNTRERGFTIVEVLISLTIFSIAVAGVITIAVQGGLNVNASKLRVTATYLADEGVELMRAMRDTTVLSTVLASGAGSEGAGWASFTGTFGGTVCTAGSPCDIDPTILSTPFPSTTNVVACASSGFCPLYYVPATGHYSDTAPSGTAASPYSRQIVVSSLTPDEVQVVVRVRYLEGTTMQTVTQTENLFNWY
jgi:prepilin-type N-terminal cleavage/methylation domain-containing protein